MAIFYCEYCGTKRFSMSSLTNGFCKRHPEGLGEGKHSLYKGSEKTEYICKYCGMKRTSIASLTHSFCPKHPNGARGGRHTPAL